MATEGGRADSPLIKTLFDEAHRFDFFQAVRLLERTDPRRLAVGRDGQPAREAVRFRTRVSLEFPASQIHEISGDGAGADAPPEMVVAFMGLTGPLGVLPNHYTELLAERVQEKDTALWAFLDLFNHRLISLFFRAWEKHRFPIAYERRGDDRFTAYLFAFVGLGTGELLGRLSVPDENLLQYCGLIAQRPHSASAIEAAVGDYFGVTARLEQFSGQWFTLDEESVTRLGTANSLLGVSTIAGQRVWDDQSKFRLKLGPLTLEQFTAFLPVGSAFKPVTDLTRFLAGLELDFDVQLILMASEVPACALNTRGDARPRLGWNTWLKTLPFAGDDSQVVLREQSAAVN
ncbi:MAG: type VI secretion system baseplate subunit TssG [Acidobacteria bacterium]|nr:type VI secretion system baseplate subunit TssG [Acidobacteriota bacterium]